MFTPDGQPADKMDKIMLLAQWTQTLSGERAGASLLGGTRRLFISAGMGKPTFPINTRTISASMSYWANKLKARLKTSVHPSDKFDEQGVISYGDPRGDVSPRDMMARAMSRWYGTVIGANDILFTLGGAGALRVIFETFNQLYPNTPNYRVITPFPHYPLYADNQHQLHPIDVMQSPGYRLTADLLENSIIEAFQRADIDLGQPKVVLLCNPNSPLGTVLSDHELSQIAAVLRRYPSLHVVLDEAYAEMCFSGENAPSLLAIAPDLMPRIIIMRSATKALSAAGERMGVLMAFDPALMAKLLTINIRTIGHAPRSGQMAYAETMLEFTNEDHLSLAHFYQPKVAYVSDRLKKMGAQMPDPLYTVEGTFYILADFSDLLGLELPVDAARALGKTGPVHTSEELAYYLLFNDAIMLAPGSYFGMPRSNGFLRITCSAEPQELAELMNRLESRLVAARQQKKARLLKAIDQDLSALSDAAFLPHSSIISEVASIAQGEDSSLALKEKNHALQKIHSGLSVQLKRESDVAIINTATMIQSAYRRHLAARSISLKRDINDHHWRSFLDCLIPDRPGAKRSRVKHFLSALSAEERSEVAPWLDYINQKEREVEVVSVGMNKRR
ncbi:MAG TPA: pyridoxal phosphate-dependent aminotransferase [Legionella sp.]|nr:pyridoxal phosphate-dependent aminotransferase [Legionella sp.]